MGKKGRWWPGERTGVSGQWSGVGGDEGLKCGMDDTCGGMIRTNGWKGVWGWMSRMVGAMGILMTPHRRHVYQLLANEMGIAHWKVSVGYGLLQLLVGVSVLVIRGYGTVAVVVLLVGWFGAFGCASFLVRRKLIHHRGTEDTEGDYFFVWRETTPDQKMPRE